jgi:hypothetical protein
MPYGWIPRVNLLEESGHLQILSTFADLYPHWQISIRICRSLFHIAASVHDQDMLNSGAQEYSHDEIIDTKYGAIVVRLALLFDLFKNGA